MRNGLSSVFRDEATNLVAKVIGISILLIGANVAAWLWALTAFHNYPILLGTATLAYKKDEQPCVHPVECRYEFFSTGLGGQRQAVAIARAIYWQAKVVLLDEPTAALAVMERERVVDHARNLAAHGVGVIYIGHNLVEILKVADRIAVMFRGRMVHVTRARETNQETLIKYMTGYTDSAKAA